MLVMQKADKNNLVKKFTINKLLYKLIMNEKKSSIAVAVADLTNRHLKVRQDPKSNWEKKTNLSTITITSFSQI